MSEPTLGGGFLRERMTEVIEQAARQGFPGAGHLWDMSLREAELALEGFAAGQRQAEARDERLAWMAGYYVALAVHAPRRYPKRSGVTFRAAGTAGAMSEDQMKGVLTALAEQRREAYDAGNAED